MKLHNYLTVSGSGEVLTVFLTRKGEQICYYHEAKQWHAWQKRRCNDQAHGRRGNGYKTAYGARMAIKAIAGRAKREAASRGYWAPGPNNG